MTINVRAVILVSGRLVIHRVHHQGDERITRPGGRVKERETVEAALVREVDEETGLRVVVGPLLYVAEVVSPYSTQNLELVFLADLEPGQVLDELDLIDPRKSERDSVLPPILDQIANDGQDGWADVPRWLGNIHVTGIGA
jgi:ADP-ribose pyrophosphatase YjhB (NUDIX family)